MKPLSQKFEKVFTPCGDAINPKMNQNGPNFVHAAMLIERWKSKRKGAHEIFVHDTILSKFNVNLKFKFNLMW